MPRRVIVALFAAAVPAAAWTVGYAGAAGSAAAPVHGPRAAQEGDLRLVLDRTRFPVGRRAQLRFRVLDGSGGVVRDFEVAHERRMHVIVVRKDLTVYQHIHPRLGDDGRWRVPLELRRTGRYRVFADFRTNGTAHVLHEDVSTPGRYRPRRLPAPSDTGRTGPYRVSLERDGGDVRFTVRRRGRLVDDLQPYLGARGHLVVLRRGDLEYLHAHPEAQASADPAIRFTVHYPSADRYRLFLQFRHRDRVRTVSFTQAVDAAHPDPGHGPSPTPTPGSGQGDHGDHDDHPH